MFLPAQPSSASASRLSNLSSSLSSLALRMDGRSIGSEHHEGGPLPLGPLKKKEKRQTKATITIYPATRIDKRSTCMTII